MKTEDMQIKEPTSAYDVLGRVIELIREEPRRLRMDTWGTDASVVYGAIDPRKPPCGTIACVAGWASTVIDGEITAFGASMARLLAGINRTETPTDRQRGLYRALYYDLFIASEFTESPQFEFGSAEEAERVIERIEEIRERFEEELRENTINPGAGAGGL